jgi:Flp pilus assembly protein TadB
MDFLSAACLSVAILSLGLGISASSRSPARSSLIGRLLARSTRELAAARITTNPVGYLALSLVAPPVLFALGWLESPVLALAAAAAGLLTPRVYVASVVHLQSQRSEAEAPRLLQALTAGLAAGGTYLDALRQARLGCRNPWLREDLDLVIQRFLLNEPLHDALREVRARTKTRNLGLIWETLRICTEHHLPTAKARGLLLDLTATINFNLQLANEVRARSSGQRAQVWLLAIIVPAMYLYLRLMSPQLLSILDDTIVGRFILFPLAAALELGGIVLSFRIAKLEA